MLIQEDRNDIELIKTVMTKKKAIIPFLNNQD